WGSDTGGYEQFGDREGFARWVEFSAFCPIMEIGGTREHPPWGMPTGPPQDPPMVHHYPPHPTPPPPPGPHTYPTPPRAHPHRPGRPSAKPLVFDYQDDPRVADLGQEYLYGDDILAAPVWHVGQTTQHVYLPEGRWVDYWDNSRVLTGPLELDEPAPLDRIPI